MITIDPSEQPAALAQEPAPPGDIGRTATRGGLLLGLRQVLSMLMAAVSAVLLARWLKVSDFGIFAQINFAVLTLAILVVGDLGLTLALVRLEAEPARTAWRSVSGLSLCMGAATAVAAAVTGLAVHLAPPFHSWWIPALGLALAARFNRTVPAARLQRDGRFAGLALAETLSMVVYFAVSLGLVRVGWGVSGLVLGVLFKEGFGLAALYLVARPSVIPAWPRLDTLRGLLRVGLPYQLSGLFTGSTDAFQPVIIGWLLGTTALGFVSWAYSLILMPLLVLEALDRVIVPTLARAQRSPATFARWTERAIRINCLVAFPAAALLLTSIEPVTVVVFTSKWLPASQLVRQFVPSILAVACFTPMLQAFNAQGRTSFALRLSIVWAALTWSLATVLVATWGLHGYGWFYVGLQMTYLPIAVMGVRRLHVNLWRAARGPLGGFLAALGSAWLVPVQGTWPALLLRITVIGGAFLAGSLALGSREVSADVRVVVRALRTSPHHPHSGTVNSPQRPRGTRSGPGSECGQPVIQHQEGSLDCPP